MALQVENSLVNPVPHYDKLHMRQSAHLASAEVNDVSFNISAMFRFYYRGDNTGTVDSLGQPIYEKHWAPTDMPSSMVSLEVKDLDSWLATHLSSEDEEIRNKAAFVADTLYRYQQAMGMILSVEKPELGNVEVV